MKQLIRSRLCTSYCTIRHSSTEKLRITPRSVDYSEWYNDVITGADMVDQSPVRGMMVIKPWGMGIWDMIHRHLDDRIRELGAQNAYFPVLIPSSFLAKEAEHIAGFAKECAVVTHHRLHTIENGDGKETLAVDPSSKLEDPLVIRPTSETMIWHMFSKWITSHRDLPLKINQWANIIRWEMRTRPFLRTSEFLWQEGHTAHATADCALATCSASLQMYAATCEDLLAIPTIKGVKSPSERFAGAVETFTIESLMQNGWALQTGTSHFLGQNFAKAFDCSYQSVTGSRESVYATSWGVSTRLIGALIMTHSDDKGLVLPPRVAPVQVIIVPVLKNTAVTTSECEGEDAAVMSKVEKVAAVLRRAGVRVKIDDRNHVRAGAKYFEWERKGVPLRLELGARDLKSGTAVLVSRLDGLKTTISTQCDADTGMDKLILDKLDRVHAALLSQAKDRLEKGTHIVQTYDQMKQQLSTDNGHAGLFLVPWRCDAANEAAIKADCKATIRCYPLSHNVTVPLSGVLCFYSQQQATHMALFARAF